ncbi:hypothetical protein [Estrella lausannensis]|uniref:Putative membrane protein n=1 Tax=Estrella lausannensis TaxID=483423 RepID=A0A0H5DQ67_9BACT|nr:hypothetical protein [Estrella lausannensis]CRX37674.1 putative membrane protein [Estrella lausannensis]
MITFQILNDKVQLNPFLETYHKNGWELDITVRGTVVNDKCRKVSQYYCGRAFKLWALAKKQCSTIEKVIRVICGVLATVVTLGLALSLQSVRNLFTDGKNAVGFVTFYKDSGPGYALNGGIIDPVNFFKVGKVRTPIISDADDSNLDQGVKYLCTGAYTRGNEPFDVALDAIEVRDHLESYDPSVVEADYSLFKHAGEFTL